MARARMLRVTGEGRVANAEIYSRFRRDLDLDDADSLVYTERFHEDTPMNDLREAGFDVWAAANCDKPHHIDHSAREAIDIACSQ